MSTVPGGGRCSPKAAASASGVAGIVGGMVNELKLSADVFAAAALGVAPPPLIAPDNLSPSVKRFKLSFMNIGSKRLVI